MRKILTQAEKERKSQRNVIILSVIMLGLLVLSTVGYAFLSGDKTGNQKSSGSSKATETGGLWAIQKDGQTFYFVNSTENVENISVNVLVTLANYAGKTLYIASDNNGIASEIGSNLGKYASRAQKACYGNCTEDLPTKNCTGTDNLIVFNKSETNKVSQRDNCVFIDGDMRAVDAFLYKLLGVN